MGATPELGVCYYPEHWPEETWKSDAKRMVDMGLSWVRIGEFSWSRIEPQPGEYNWDWLDKAIKTLSEVGLKIILGTPSATPPFWMVSRFPDMLAITENGEPRKFGSRRHYSHSHQAYRDAAAHMAERMSKRYGKHKAIHAWQVDNEYGCHDTVLSYDASAKKNFRQWLSEKYGNIEQLNTAWGNVFWSMEYPNFDAIDLPNQSVTEPNPSHVMDFRRFASHEVIQWNKAQLNAIRRHSDRPIIHNYMGRVLEFDHFELGKDLEIASWDSYPLGFLEDRSDQDEAFKQAYVRQGDPDFQAFHHDLYRSVGGMKSDSPRWWVMEQQPGSVNWAPHNPAPLPGMVKLWSWEAIAHGAEVVSYFRWRQAPFAQEQMHAGLLATNGTDMPVTQDVLDIAKSLPQLSDQKTEVAKIAIVFDYPSAWAWDIQAQGDSFSYFRLVLDVYSQLRKRGYSIDILPSSASDFGDRKYVFIPGLMSWNDHLRQAVLNFKGQTIIGPRTGSKTPDFQIPPNLAPDIQKFDINIVAVESLREGLTVRLESEGHAKFWREFANTNESVLLKYADGWPALISKHNMYYITGWFDDGGFSALFEKIGLDNSLLAEGVRQRDLGQYRFFMNYSAKRQNVILPTETIFIEPAGVILFDTDTETYKSI